ncbi:MAG TPA: hypothetical protein IAA58_02320 [Candidatus Gallacutalibacter stercoravium]|nr:hypothetical protein [Candidatus Gallacutalibacter stercoravium]
MNKKTQQDFALQARRLAGQLQQSLARHTGSGVPEQARVLIADLARLVREWEKAEDKKKR